MLDHPQGFSGAQQVCWLPLDRITPRVAQPFSREEGESMAELCASIRRDGLISPITVQRMAGGGFMVVSGNRRYLACRMLGLSHIDAVVVPGMAAEDSLREMVDALLSRQLHYLEEGRVIQRVLDSGLMGREALARHMGVTSATLREKLRCNDLQEDLRILLMEQNLPEGIARALLRLPDHAARMRIALKAARERLSIREVEVLVASAQHRLPAPPMPGGKTIALVRDHRLYLNAIRAIAAQMKEAGLDGQMTERTLPDAVEVTLRLPTRCRRRQGSSGR